MIEILSFLWHFGQTSVLQLVSAPYLCISYFACYEGRMCDLCPTEHMHLLGTVLWRIFLETRLIKNWVMNCPNKLTYYSPSAMGANIIDNNKDQLTLIKTWQGPTNKGSDHDGCQDDTVFLIFYDNTIFKIAIIDAIQILSPLP